MNLNRKKRVCVFTSARSDYFLLYPLLDELRKQSNSFELQLVAAGMHTSKEFGDTWKLIEDDGFSITEKPSILISSDDVAATVTSMGIGLVHFSSILKRLNPDIIILLGDRFEMMSFATAAHIFGIPIVHIHGGELTYGAFDDAIRHCITKMATLHFPAAEDYKRRIIQMGEHPENVFNVGSLSVDTIQNSSQKTISEIASILNIPLKENYFLVTFHPETKGESNVKDQLETIFKSLEQFPEHQILWTCSNADPLGRTINEIVQSKVGPLKAKYFIVDNLGTLYLSTLRNAHLVLGNSSSALIEAPIIGIPTVNIGCRQDGRIRTSSIIDCDFNIKNISNAIQKALSVDFIKESQKRLHPYGNGNTAKKIIEHISSYDFQKNAKKVFYDIT